MPSGSAANCFLTGTVLAAAISRPVGASAIADQVVIVRKSRVLRSSLTVATVTVLAGALHDDLEGRAQGRIEGELADELTLGRKLDQLARLVRISVDRVAVGREQIAVGCQRQADRTTKVRLILVDQGTRAVIRMRLARVLDGENLVVAR